jgi:hypothetical protein
MTLYSEFVSPSYAYLAFKEIGSETGTVRVGNVIRGLNSQADVTGDP